MALLTLHRIPSLSTAPDESLQKRGRLQKRESFALVKGAVLLLEEGEGEDPHSETSHKPTSPTKKEGGTSNTRHRHLHAMIEQLRPEDTIQLAVQLESMNPSRVRYLIVVSTLGSKQESVLLGMDFPDSDSDRCTIGLVLPIWSDMQVYLDGDGGFSVTSAEETRIFKPVSMQTMWSVLQALHGCCERAVKAVLIPGSGLEWAEHYQKLIESDRFCLNEWEAMDDLESVRKDVSGQSSADRLSNEMLIKENLRDIMRTEDLDNLTSKMVHSSLESRIGFDMRPYKEYIDNEILVTMAQMDKPSKILDFLYLGSEWNAANFEELQKNNVGYILNVTREIDNFFPESFTYMNIRVYDVEATDLLPYWTDTYKFINTARKRGKAVLVHCKMGVSRSSSTVMAYVMKQQRWSMDVAMGYVRDHRSIVKPNDGFLKQLQTYDGILNASRQRHSALWRRKSRDQRQKSIRKEEEGDEGKPEEEEEEEEEEDEEYEEDQESPDDKDSGCSEEKDESEEEEEVFEEPVPTSDTNQDLGPTEPAAVCPTITLHEPEKVASSINRSGRMNLFSLMQSISELDAEDKGREQLPGSPKRSPGQRRRSNARRGLTHQTACVDVSPEPRSLPD
ncbi:protein phosphatase Slingshot homolog 3 [Pleuronectes platessa]|uniref:protein phosphatase Slingshot homolog 3 n=1 Tax=Pleuronectes platessa TaxID=8262 RepID=UPI00232A4EEC|nr:protein phosphatase Slingshot homolog 3 [Pleuronectes platessa]XP_053284079.1 protein phosphatase Slingshot homolog 3 [Pleuronectes platessa]XP_053284081.1 protein phosphatase Slingshot homolog 3 [Pleuronectes platessa]XP_053284082.1 protein phosphatase Slingshot homolog 3 [Pleuronectes platessa]XP_053284083.1 protein phosphatase Slingshot homolog 3 [Pleuronectes platessa]